MRRFLHFSEQAAHDAGLQPQQHQLLLQVAAVPQGQTATIAYAAERLGLRHNSTVELADRCVAEGLLRRAADSTDRRKVVLRLTPHGASVLRELSDFHARELYELAPGLLRGIRGVARAKRAGTRA